MALDQAKSETAQREEEVLKFWKENHIFEKTLGKQAPKGDFVFYDGPPFATGLPHYGSLLSSIVKDVIPRYKTMQGYHVPRVWGWDCHGLPIENMVEKELGLKSKKEIEEMGVAKFNRACRNSVLRFVHEWKRFVDRVGRFVDFDNSYKTMDNSFIESVWWGISEIHKKGLLYEGRKVLLYCPHCETPLAKAEIAMDHSYKDITEESVYIKFKVKNPEKIGLKGDVYLLAWTTTPWTLPGNVALAVGNDITYISASQTGQDGQVIFARERAGQIAQGMRSTDREFKGSDLVGLEYEPLFEIPAAKEFGKKAWYVAPADFVTTEEGTGVVHTAVIYGEDDYELGLRLDLPMVPLLDAGGHFNEKAPELIRGQYFKKAEKVIKDDLESRGLLFKREMHTHSYPHCHRCGTALLYNAISSWFINIQEVKSRMIKLNEKINWVPEHLKHGRFLNIVENAPDWTISRNRYWASPLPIWKDESGKVHVVGSVEELKSRTKKSGNHFFVMRHGEGEHNVKNILSSGIDSPYHLTEKGKEQVQKRVKEIKRDKIAVIYASPLLRSRETAEIVASELGIPKEKIIIDDRLQELEFGDFNGKPYQEYLDFEAKHMPTYDVPAPRGESYLDAKRRFGEFLYEIDTKHKDENILIVSHGIALETLLAVIEGADMKRSKEIIDNLEPELAALIDFEFVPLPHNEEYELDLHRPYIDEIELLTEGGKSLKRIPEVIDGWVESGSMSFAQDHYPFENKKEFKKRFPGDFIAEYIAQTRTWFYYMHAVAVLLFDSHSFKNVVTTGNILAEDGTKMSKSKGNFTDPMLNLDRFGADALRYYLMSSVVMQAEDTRFVDEEVRLVHNQVVNILWNSFKFYELYKNLPHAKDATKSKNILDRWIISRLNEVIEATTKGFDAYNTVEATRPVRDFVSDFSTWYVRRSRDRFKGEDEDDRSYALGTTRYVLYELSKLIAPVMPFIAEDIYRSIKRTKDPESVHLAEWPEGGKIKNDLLSDMAVARMAASQGLEARSGAGIKVRQPLSSLTLKDNTLSEKDEFISLIKDEVNVKEVLFDGNITSSVVLHTEITPELKAEGDIRDLIRSIQDLRKESGLTPEDSIALTITTDAEGEKIINQFSSEIKRVVRASSLVIQKGEKGFNASISKV